MTDNLTFRLFQPDDLAGILRLGKKILVGAEQPRNSLIIDISTRLTVNA